MRAGLGCDGDSGHPWLRLDEQIMNGMALEIKQSMDTTKTALVHGTDGS
jgi:hypothetical protein